MGVLWVPPFLSGRRSVYELCRVRWLRREALPLPDFGDERVQHVGGDGLPELEVSVPDCLSRGYAVAGRQVKDETIRLRLYALDGILLTTWLLWGLRARR